MVEQVKIHEGQRILTAGEPLEQAKAAMILVHGRGATAESILGLADNFSQPGFAYLAPQAANNTWYPYPFMTPLEQNEPYLSSAFGVIESLIQRVNDAGIPSDRLMLLGFSQGACLTLEYTARHAQHYGAIVGLSGALMGPDDTPRNYPGNMQNTPVFLGCSDVDFHIPKNRVRESGGTLCRLGAVVTERIYPNMGHTVNRDEIEFVKREMELVVNP